MANKKVYAIASITIIILFLSFSMVSAGWFGDFWNKITGNVIVSPSDCIINGVEISTDKITDVLGDTNSDIIDISQAEIKQVSKDYIQLDLKLKTADIPFYNNDQGYIWFLDTTSLNNGDDFIIRLNSISGSGINESWHVWIESNIEGRGIYHFPATKFGDTFSVLIPLKLLYYPESIKWRARAEYMGNSDDTSSSEYILNYNKTYPNLMIIPSGNGITQILSSDAYFYNLDKANAATFIVKDKEKGVIINNTEYYSSYNKRFQQISFNSFKGVGNGISMLFSKVNNCYLVQPLVIANGKYSLTGNSTAFVYFNTKNYTGVTDVTDILSSIQKNLVGYYPHNNQLLIVEESDSNVLASPNTPLPIPVPLYLSDYLDDGVWFYFTHEYGHHFIGGNLKIVQMLRDSYAESLASETGYYAMEELINNYSKYNISLITLNSLKNGLAISKNNFFTDLGKYESAGAPYEKLWMWPPEEFDPNNVYNAMIIEIQNLYGRQTITKFFKIFQPAQELLDISLLNQIQPKTNDEVSTFFVAAWSISANNDLRPLFKDRWNFPINDTYYDIVHSVLNSLVNYPSLDLLSPSINGLNIEQNGVTFATCGDLDLNWCKTTNPTSDGTGPFEFKWGDGKVSCSWFPAKHIYSSSGNYTIKVRVKNTCGFISERQNQITLIKPKYILTCQKQSQYTKSWHTTPCSSYACGKDKYIKCEKRWIGRYSYREVCQSLTNYNTACSETSTCGSNKEIKRTTCA